MEIWNIIDIGIEVDRVGATPINRVLIIAGVTVLADRFRRWSRRYRTGIKVDVAAGLILIGIFYVVLRPGEQNFVIPPNVLDVMGNWPIRISNPLVSLTQASYSAPLFIGTGTGHEQWRNQRER